MKYEESGASSKIDAPEEVLVRQESEAGSKDPNPLCWNHRSPAGSFLWVVVDSWVLNASQPVPLYSGEPILGKSGLEAFEGLSDPWAWTETHWLFTKYHSAVLSRMLAGEENQVNTAGLYRGLSGSDTWPYRKESGLFSSMQEDSGAG